MRHFLSVWLLFVPACAMAQEGDSVRWDVPCKAEHRFRPKQVIAPAVLLGAGAVGVGVESWRVKVRDGVAEMKGGHGDVAVRVCGRQLGLEDGLQFVPLAVNAFLGCTGVRAKHRVGDRVLITATAGVVQTALTEGLKYTVRERRPMGYPNGKRTSFPSGHAARAFTGAELARMEYGWKVGGPMYAVAAATAFLRVYHEWHWYNDVLAGAGIGILSANVANWVYPVEKRWFTPKRKRQTAGAQVIALPSYVPDSKAAGLVLVASF